MKTIRITLFALLFSFTFTSCIVEENTPIYLDNEVNNGISLDQLLQSKDLWYVNINQTYGNGDVRFLSLAFTLSFRNGNIYANNNIVGIGNVGNGLGDQIGYYSTNQTILEIDHDIDGFMDFEVIQTSNNHIKLKSFNQNVTYQLTGYNLNEFNFDVVFYDNIEFFLQEYMAWEKTATLGGVTNQMDNENFLAFIPENQNTFLSSQDQVGTNLEDVIWDYDGNYEVFDVQGYDDVKVLELHYAEYGVEEFELTVENDQKIILYHYDSDTTYEFEGLDQIIYKKQSLKKENTKELRKRFKVIRNTKVRRIKQEKMSNR
ncbi:MAG TPA: hypothetical protein ENK67_07415 [Flavobacteriia bacterium]|jgi:hypothetical protein|nr:hypothetical protein [Flavobacteriia bacterium]